MADEVDFNEVIDVGRNRKLVEAYGLVMQDIIDNHASKIRNDSLKELKVIHYDKLMQQLRHDIDEINKPTDILREVVKSIKSKNRGKRDLNG